MEAAQYGHKAETRLRCPSPSSCRHHYTESVEKLLGDGCGCGCTLARSMTNAPKRATWRTGRMNFTPRCCQGSALKGERSRWLFPSPCPWPLQLRVDERRVVIIGIQVRLLGFCQIRCLNRLVLCSLYLFPP